MKILPLLFVTVLAAGCGTSTVDTPTGPSGVDAWSISRTTVPSPTIPTGPNSCPDGGYPEHLFANVHDTSVLFLWTPIQNIEVYGFEVEKFGGDFDDYHRFDQFMADPKGVQHGRFYTDWQVASAEAGRYRVRIRTKNRCDNFGPWSPWATFDFDGRDSRGGPGGGGGGQGGSFYSLGANILPFGMLAGAAITCTASTVTGNVGVSPGSAITGFPGLCTLNGSIISTGNSAQAAADLANAYDAFVAEPCTPIAALLDGVTLTPGVYCSAAAVTNLTGTLTLSGAGRYVIRFPSTFITSPGSAIALTNGATCGGVNFVAGSSATLAGTLTGNVIAFSSVTMNPGASTTGRLLARNAAVTISTSTLNISGCS